VPLYNFERVKMLSRQGAHQVLSRPLWKRSQRPRGRYGSPTRQRSWSFV